MEIVDAKNVKVSDPQDVMCLNVHANVHVKSSKNRRLENLCETNPWP